MWFPRWIFLSDELIAQTALKIALHVTQGACLLSVFIDPLQMFGVGNEIHRRHHELRIHLQLVEDLFPVQIFLNHLHFTNRTLYRKISEIILWS